MGAPTRDPGCGAAEAVGLAVVGLAFDNVPAGTVPVGTVGLAEAGMGVGTGAILGMAIGPLHFGQGKVCPSIASWRTMILLEQ